MSGVLAKMKTRTPNCSVFPFDFRNKFSNRIGQLTPVAVIEMGPNDRLKMSMAQLTRLMPMSAPVMANFQLQVDSVFVPARIVAKKYEKFFNAGTQDSDRPYFPSLAYKDYIDILVNRVGLYNHSLLDYLGFPTFENVKEFYRNLITSVSVSDDSISWSSLGNPSQYHYFEPDALVMLRQTGSGSLTFGAFYNVLDTEYNVILSDEGKFSRYAQDSEQTVLESAPWYIPSSSAPLLPDLLTFVVCNDLGLAITPQNAISNLDIFRDQYGISRYGAYATVPDGFIYNTIGTQSEVIEKWLNANNKHMDELLDEYFSYVARWLNDLGVHFKTNHNTSASLQGFKTFEQLLAYNDTSTNFRDYREIRERKLSLLPVFSFWKAYFDWYVSSVLEHGEDLTDAWTNFCNCVISESASLVNANFDGLAGFGGFESEDADILCSFFGIELDSYIASVLFKIPARLWSVDRFTGAYTDTQNGQAVLIPTDGTIRDLKASNQLQRYLEKALFGGTRTIDKNELIYGAHSSNQLLDRTEVLSRKKFNVDIQQVTNSAASDAFDLGTLAGNGFGMGSQFLFDYTCEERGYVMIFASVVLPPSYVQALDRNLLHTDYYDFVIPEFDSVGEQEIMPEELYFDKGMSVAPVGYNRRYYEAIDFLSSVHGDLKNTLKHWHDARYFKNAPTLSPEFIRIDPENDDLERIFASYAHDQLLHFFAFSGAVVRPMSKYIQFGAL